MPISAPTLSSLKPQTRPRDNRQSACNRGYDSKWQRVRLSYLAKHPLCIECEKQGITELAVVVDHIKPHQGNKQLFWDNNNWQSLCIRHHNIKTGQERRQFNQIGYSIQDIK
jgi:5-methylcytosine-specific restriction enzyme A